MVPSVPHVVAATAGLHRAAVDPRVRAAGFGAAAPVDVDTRARETRVGGVGERDDVRIQAHRAVSRENPAPVRGAVVDRDTVQRDEGATRVGLNANRGGVSDLPVDLAGIRVVDVLDRRVGGPVSMLPIWKTKTAL